PSQTGSRRPGCYRRTAAWRMVQWVAATPAHRARPSPPSGLPRDRPKIPLAELPVAEPPEQASAARRPLQAASSRAAARGPCWDRQTESARLSPASIHPSSLRPAPEPAQQAAAEEPAQARPQPPRCLAASNPMAARRPCWDRQTESLPTVALETAE